MATNDYTIPRASALFNEGGSAPTREWYNYLNFLGTTTVSGLQDEITTISFKLGSPDGTPGNIPPIKSGGQVRGVESIVNNGLLPNIVTLNLVGDIDSPGNTYYYGTDLTGSKSFYTVASAFLGTAGNIVLTVDSGGITTINLAVVPDIGGGVLQKTSFDTFGRKTGTSSATSDDLPEGQTNLYDLPINAIALTALTFPHVVASDGAGNVYYPDLTNHADVSSIIGITLHAAAMGAPVQVIDGRTFTEPGWSWVQGPIYCSLSGGGLTQTPAGTGAIVEVGHAINATTIYAKIGLAILR